MICKFFTKEGSCRKGDKCEALHVLQGVGKTNLLSMSGNQGYKVDAVALHGKHLYLSAYGGINYKLVVYDIFTGQALSNQAVQHQITHLVSMGA